MLSIPVRLDVSAEKAEQALRRFYAGVENALDGIVDLNGTVINFDVNFRKTGDDVVKALNDTDAAQKKVEKSAKKLDQGQEKSLKRSKFRISQLKQERDKLELNSKAYKRKSKELKRVEAQLLSLQGVQRGSITALKAGRAELIQVRNNLKINSAEYNRLTAEIEKFDATLKGNTQQVKKAKAASLGFVKVFANIAVVSAGIQSIGAALRSVGNAIDVYARRTKDVEGFNLALQNVGFTQEGATATFKQARRTALALGAPLQQVEKTYKRMIPALQGAGISAKESDKFIEAITARTQTLGLNTEQSGRLLEAFAQVLSKGKLQAEELNQQISELDGAFRTQLADALGVTTEQLTEMVKNSEVTSDVFVKAINDMSNGVDALLSRVREGNLTMQQFQNIIQTLDTINIENIGKAIEPALKSFLAIRLAFAEFVREFSKTSVFNFLVITFNGIAKGLELFIKGLLNAIAVINSMLSIVAPFVNFVLSLGEQFGGLVGILTQVTLSFGLATVAVMLYKKAMNMDKTINNFIKNNLRQVAAMRMTIKTALKFALPIAAVVAGIQILSSTMKSGTKDGREFDAALKDLNSTMQDLNTGFPDVGKALMSALNMFNPLKHNLITFADLSTKAQISEQMTKIRHASVAASAAIKKQGINTKDLSSFTNVSTESLKKLLTFEQEREKTMEIGMKTAERRLKIFEREGKVNLHKQTKLQIQRLKDEQKVNNENIEVFKQVLSARGEKVEATEKEIEVLKKLKEATEKSITNNSLIALQERTKAIKELGNETELLAAANLGIQQAESESNLEIYDDELKKIKKNALANKKIGDEEKERMEELTLLIAQERAKQAQLGLDAQNLINDALEQGIQKAQELGEVSGSAASDLVGAFDGLAGSLTQGLSAATSLMDQLVADEIKGLEVGSRMRQEIVLKQLRGQAQANELEHQISKQKLAVQNMIAISEAKIAQIRLRAEAEVARSRGQHDLAGALENAANMQDLVVAGLQEQFRINNHVLDIEKRKKDQALIRKAIDEKITNNQSKAGQILGVQRTDLDDSLRILNKMESESTNLLDAFADSAEKAQNLKEDANKVAIQEGAKEADKIAGAFNRGADAAERMKNELSDVVEFSKEISRLVGGATISNPPRAMGGPVQGGSSYFVNDGGGREGFLSNSGNFSMLPAARNINWTAPTSGTVIPANLVGRYQQALAANQSVTSRTSVQPASKGVDRVSANIDSGSLVQRMAAVMSGNGGDQRITNHVTIQSQEPVTDASKIMTNVARMKLRKGGRF